MSDAYARLRAFLETTMQMQHVYQPVMLETLLLQGGSASIRDIAAAILAHDDSQLDYYAHVVKRMPGDVLHKHDIVRRDGDGYALASDLADLTEEERTSLITLCRDKLDSFKAQHGASAWQHRMVGLGVIPGRVRYDTLKRAAFRCELCGVSAEERALDVDHVLPRSRGGSDEPENLQSLCWLCNANKGAGDDTRFAGISESYADRASGCVFCAVTDRAVLKENALAYLIEDTFPVTMGHTLVIPRRHVADYFDLHHSERTAIERLLKDERDRIRGQNPDVVGFNVGINAGEAAGQTVMHCHVHLIPRRRGDVQNPRGGVRGVIPDKADY